MKIRLSLLAILISFFGYSQNNLRKVHVANEKEFIEAIDDNTHIIIEADTLNLTTEYLEKIVGHKPYVNFFEPAKQIFIDEPGLTLHGYENLKISGKKKVHLITNNRGQNVLVLENCNRIWLENVSLTHDVGGYRATEILVLLHSKNISIKDVTLYGDGEIGLEAVGTENISLTNVNFMNNNHLNALKAHNCRNIQLTSCNFENNDLKTLIHSDFSALQFNTCSFKNNSYKSFFEGEVSYGLYNPIFVDCQFDRDGPPKFEPSEAYYYLCEEPYEGEYDQENAGERDCDAILQYNLLEDLIYWMFRFFNENPSNVDDLLSYFERSNIDFLDHKNTTQEAVFNFFYKTGIYKSRYEIVDLFVVSPDDTRIEVVFTQKTIEHKDYDCLFSNQFHWIFEFNEQDKIIAVTEASAPELVEVEDLAIPKPPTIKSVDDVYFFDGLETWHLADFYFDVVDSRDEPFYFATYLLTQIRYHFTQTEDVFEAYTQNQLSREEKKQMKNYFSNLKVYVWKHFFEGIYAYTKPKDELLKCFEVLWKLTIMYYDGDDTDLLEVDPKLVPPKLDLDENSEVNVDFWFNINESIIRHTTYIIDSQDFYKNYDSSLINEYKDFLHYREEFRSELSKADKKKMNRFLKEYDEFIEHFDALLNTYFND